MGYLAYRYIRRQIQNKRLAPKKRPPLPAKSPYELLVDRLQELDPSSEDRLYYSLLDASFRDFLASTVVYQALEMTTTELAEAIKSVEAIRNRATASETRALLYRIALAKYAKEGYSEQIRKADCELVLEFGRRVSEALKEATNDTDLDE